MITNDIHVSNHEYIISIDLGTTFSGACYSSTTEKDRLVHVVRWPEQKLDDVFEKTPTVCLYNKETPPQLIKWGKAAVDHIMTHPDDQDVFIVDNFKLKLRPLFGHLEELSTQDINVTAAIDYLNAIHEYTCEQLVQNTPQATREKFRYVLTVPATWVSRDGAVLREIASKAGLIDLIHDPQERLIIMSEAHAASLFCEKEYCVTQSGEGKLLKGHRYLVCDAGGGTVDLATHECTDVVNSEYEHCQLALESGDMCGSTVLDDNMEIYLRDKVFAGCIEEHALKDLKNQFVKQIKHYFGGNDPNRNNCMTDDGLDQVSLKTRLMSLDKEPATLLTTTLHTPMENIHENDYDYNQDYADIDEEQEEQEKLSCFEEEDVDMDDYFDENDDDMFENSSDEEQDEQLPLTTSDYIYFTLPKDGIDPLVMENLEILKSIVVNDQNIRQLRISHQCISKYIFDPVVERVLTLIRNQIKKSHTTIDMLFLLGGFGQSPYLYKKIHQEFITNTNTIHHLVVPEHGYRASMRGGIYYVSSCIDALAEEKCLRYENGESATLPINYNDYKFLLNIDFDFAELSAKYSIIRTDGPFFVDKISNQEENFNENAVYQSFTFDAKMNGKNFLKFLLNSKLVKGAKDLANLIDAFVKHLFKSIEQTFVHSYPDAEWKHDMFRYSFTIAPMIGFPTGSNIVNEEKDTPVPLPQVDTWHPLYNQEDIDSALTGTHCLVTIPNLFWCLKNAFLKLGLVERKDAAERLLFMNANSSYKSFQFVLNTENLGEIDFVQKLGRVGRKTSTEDNDDFYPQHHLNYRFPNYLTSLQTLFFKKEQSTKYMCAFDLAVEPMICKVTQCTPQEVIHFPQKMNEFALEMKNNLPFTPNWDYMRMIQNEEQPENEYLYSKIEQQPTISTLLKFLALESNIMTAGVRAYIKENVDLGNPHKMHLLGDIFKNPKTDVQFLFSVVPSPSIYKTIERFSTIRLSTIDILLELIIPWIKFHLVPSLLDGCVHYLENASERPAKETCFFVFSRAILETKTQGLFTPFKYDLLTFFKNWKTISAREFFYQILRREMEACIKSVSYWRNIQSMVNYDSDPVHTRHMDGLVVGILSQLRQDIVRVSKRNYAVHFVKHTYAMFDPSQTSVFIKEKEKKASGGKNPPVVIETQQHNLVLHPLLSKDKQENSLKIKEREKKFYVQSGCYLAAVLYGSEENVPDYSISNPLFKKLHRFIVPVKNASKPIQINCKFQKHTLLFTVKHDDYEEDYDCDDYLFVVKHK